MYGQTITQRIQNVTQSKYPGRMVSSKVKIGSAEEINVSGIADFNASRSYPNGAYTENTKPGYNAFVGFNGQIVDESIRSAIQAALNSKEPVSVDIEYVAVNSTDPSQSDPVAEVKFSGKPVAEYNNVDNPAFITEEAPTVKIGDATINL